MRALPMVAALCTCWLTTASASGSPIVNGGFETGSLAGWTFDHAANGSLLFVAGHPHSGRDAAWFGALGGVDDSLMQSFATTPGESYTVTFWLAHAGNDNRNGFSAWWNSTPLMLLNNASMFGDTKYTLSVLATGDTTTLRFSGHALQDYYYLDDVSVTPVPTPEPSTLLLMAGGVAAWVRRRRRGRSVS